MRIVALVIFSVLVWSGSWNSVAGQFALVDAPTEATAIAGSEAADELTVGWGVTNTGAQTAFLMVTRTIESTVQPWNCPQQAGNAGAYERFCWGPICYPYCSGASSDSPANLVAIAPGDTNWTFVADYYPDEIIGTTSLSYCFHPLSGVESGVCHTMSFTLEEAAIAYGCTYFTASNFNPLATLDDGSCEFPGCLDPEALNFSPHFNVDGGGCIYNSGNPDCPSDITGDGVVTVGDLLQLLSSFGEGCG